MALPAYPLQFSPPVLDVQEVLKRLPAVARAQLAWAQKPIEDGLLRLRRDELTDALVSEVLPSLLQPLLSVGRAVSQWLATSYDELIALWMQDLQDREDCLAAFLTEEDARDTLRWVLGWLRSFYQLGSGYRVSIGWTPTDDDAWKAMAADETFRSLFRGLICFLAASDEARLGASRGRALDLLDTAFLELSRFSKDVREHGLRVSAFPCETIGERHERILHDADRLRQTLSDDDWRTLERARMHDLR